MDELYDDFFEKTDYLTETKGLLKDRINSLGGSITSGTTFRDYLVWLDSLYEALDEKTITGLPDSLEGKCEQNGTPTPSSPQPINITTGRQVASVCGNNYFNNVLNSSINLARATITYENNQIVMSTTGADAYIGNIVNAGGSWDITKGQLIPVEANTQYYLYITNNVINKNFITYYDENLTSIQVLFNVSYSQQFTTPANAKYMSFRIGNGNSTSGGIYKFNVMVGKGTLSTTYEEYKGTDYEINLGKNLFDSNTFRQGTRSSTTTTNRVFGESNLWIEQGKTYTFSTNMDTNTYRFAINISATPFPSSTLTYDSGWKRQASFTFTASVSGYLGVPISRVNDANFTPSEIEDIEWQLEKGSVASSYSPYKTPIYLGKIGTYQDYIFRNTTENPLYDSNLEEGQWYIHKEIGRVVVNGTESGWMLRSNTSPNYIKFRNDNIFPSDVKDRLQLLSNYFVANTGANDASYSGNAICGNAGQYAKWLHVSIDNTIVSDVATFKTWLGTHNLEIYYVLATPTNTLIEDEELINQLNEIEIFTVISEDFYN